MKLNIIGQTKDLRTNTFVIYAQISIDDYLTLVGDNFDEFDIQRKQEKHKAYLRMRNDILDGAVLPPITLAIKPDLVENIVHLIEENNMLELTKELSLSNQIYILDGLQRTHILNSLKKEGNFFKEGQKLLLEFWVEKEIKHLIYRLIILNAGQKTMSLRHQLELLNRTIADEIKKDGFDIELNKERDEKKRRKSRVFSFESVISSYYCFLTKNYQPNKENLITQQIQEESVMYANEEEINDKLILFKKYLSIYTHLDEKICSYYNKSLELKNYLHWFAKENVMNAFFAAVADYGNNNIEKQKRIEKALDSLLLEFDHDKDDPLGLRIYEIIVNKTIDASKKNIGLATKRFLFEGFREFFINSGDKSFTDCWTSVSPSNI